MELTNQEKVYLWGEFIALEKQGGYDRDSLLFKVMNALLRRRDAQPAQTPMSRVEREGHRSRGCVEYDGEMGYPDNRCERCKGFDANAPAEQPAPQQQDVVERMLNAWYGDTENLPPYDELQIGSMTAALAVAREGMVPASELENMRGRMLSSVDYSSKLQQLIENLKYPNSDTPYPELHHHKMIVAAKQQLASCYTRDQFERAIRAEWSKPYADGAIYCIFKRLAQLQPKPRVTVEYMPAAKDYAVFDGRSFAYRFENKQDAERYAAGLRVEIGESK